MARRLEPDVVLMDLLMPNMDGVTAIGRIKAERPETEIVTMTSFIEEEKVTSALEAGASGYVLKDAEAEEVAAAVRAAYAGEVHLDPAVARLLAQRMRDRKSPEDELAEPLTEREKDVLRLLGQGMSNKEIGATLFITERTARTYVSNILGKLGLASRTQAALYAVEHKLVDAAEELVEARRPESRARRVPRSYPGTRFSHTRACEAPCASRETSCAVSVKWSPSVRWSLFEGSIEPGGACISAVLDESWGDIRFRCMTMRSRRPEPGFRPTNARQVDI